MVGGKLLLLIGVIEVQGEFVCGEVIFCVDMIGCEVVWGLMNYLLVEVWFIVCRVFFEIELVFGYVSVVELVYWDNLVLF